MEQEQGGGCGDGQDMYKVTERCLDELRCHLDNQDYYQEEDCNEEDGAGDGDDEEEEHIQRQNVASMNCGVIWTIMMMNQGEALDKMEEEQNKDKWLKNLTLAPLVTNMRYANK